MHPGIEVTSPHLPKINREIRFDFITAIATVNKLDKFNLPIKESDAAASDM